MSDSIKAAINRAVLDFTMGEEERAENSLLEIIEIQPGNADAFRALAEVRLARQNLDGAEKACRSALALNPDDLTSMVSLSRILVAKGDKEGAEQATARARVLGWKDELAQDGDSD